MQSVETLPPVPAPAWDGTKLTFVIVEDGQRIRCAISHSALIDVIGRAHLRPAQLIEGFLEVRPRIEAIALAKFRSRLTHASGLVNIWSDDIDPPPASAPEAATADAARQCA